MVDISSVSVVVAAASVVAGVIYYSFQLRNQTKMRQTDLVMRLYSTMSSKEWLEAWEKVRGREILNYNNYKKQYGLVEFNEVVNVFEEVGVLLRRKLIDIELVDDLFSGSVKMVWEKAKPIIEDSRKLSNRPRLLRNLEYLANEMKKREQQQAKIG